VKRKAWKPGQFNVPLDEGRDAAQENLLENLDKSRVRLRTHRNPAPRTKRQRKGWS